LRTFCGKALKVLKNLVQVEWWLSSSRFLCDWVLLLLLGKVVHPLCDSNEVFIPRGFKKSVSSSFVW